MRHDAPDGSQTNTFALPSLQTRKHRSVGRKVFEMRYEMRSAIFYLFTTNKDCLLAYLPILNALFFPVGYWWRKKSRCRRRCRPKLRKRSFGLFLILAVELRFYANVGATFGVPFAAPAFGLAQWSAGAQWSARFDDWERTGGQYKKLKPTRSGKRGVLVVDVFNVATRPHHVICVWGITRVCDDPLCMFAWITESRKREQRKDVSLALDTCKFFLLISHLEYTQPYVNRYI